MSDFTERNPKVIMELGALIEGLGYGSMDFSLDVHGKRITHLTLYGKRRNVYKIKDQDQAYKDVITRIKQAVDTKQSQKLTFVVDIDKGKVNEILWLSKYKRNYEELDK